MQKEDAVSAMEETSKDRDTLETVDIGDYKIGVLIKVRNWKHGEDFCSHLGKDIKDLAGIVIADGVSSEKNSYEVAKNICDAFLDGLKRYYDYYGDIEGYILNFEDKYVENITNDLRDKNMTGASTFASVVIHNDRIYIINIGNTDIYLLSMPYADYIKPNIKQNIDNLTAAIHPQGVSGNVQSFITKIYESPLIIILGTDGAKIGDNINNIFEKIREICRNILREYGIFNIEKFMRELSGYFNEYLSSKNDDDASVGVLVVHNIKSIRIDYVLDKNTREREISFTEYPWSFIEKIIVKLPDDEKFTAIGNISMHLVDMPYRISNVYVDVIFDLIIKNEYARPIIDIHLDSDCYQIKHECDYIDIINDRVIRIDSSKYCKSTENDKTDILRCKVRITLDINKISRKQSKKVAESIQKKIEEVLLEAINKTAQKAREQLDDIIKDALNENIEKIDNNS